MVHGVFTKAVRIKNDIFFVDSGSFKKKKIEFEIVCYVLIAEELLGQEILNLGQEDGLHDREGQRVMQVIKPSHDTLSASM